MAHTNQTSLKDRVLWFDGDSTVSEEKLSEIFASGLPIKGLCVDNPSSAIKQFNLLVSDEDKIKSKTDCRPNDLHWNIPEDYQDLDVEDYVFVKLEEHLDRLGFLPLNDNLDGFNHVNKFFDRVNEELELFEHFGLIDFLRTLIFIINTLQSNSVVWGVGRGSCVSSYVLFLIGVHDVDSIQYELDITDFLRIE